MRSVGEHTPVGGGSESEGRGPCMVCGQSRLREGKHSLQVSQGQRGGRMERKELPFTEIESRAGFYTHYI